MVHTVTSTVIVLNGGSSSGKTSIARALQELLPGLWLTFGVDTFVDALPGGGDSPRAGISYERDGAITFSPGFRVCERAWYAGLSGMARTGALMILDEVFLTGSAGQERLRQALDGSDVFWVGVRCDADLAERRESCRADRQPGMARRQASSVHAGVTYDLEVDTTHRFAKQCAQDIAERLYP